MELYERRRRILAAVVDDYVETAEPIGSETLVRRHDFGVKSATIRNELAAMSEMGYLRQPHTSAGRVPSDLGYRFYINELMPSPTLTLEDSYRVRQGMGSIESEIEDILQRACSILAGISNYTSVVTPPRADRISIGQVALLLVKPGKLLVITVLSTGHIDHRIVDYTGSLSQTNVVSLANLLNARCKGVDLNTFNAKMEEELPRELRLLDWIYKKITSAIKQALLSLSDDHIFIEGTGHILEQPEFEQSERAASVFKILEQRRTLFQVLSSTLLGRDVTVIIGSENSFDEMRECSFVASSYCIGGKPCGSIGVIGPTRMDYRRAIAAIRFMASNLSDLLTTLSIG